MRKIGKKLLLLLLVLGLVMSVAGTAAATRGKASAQQGSGGNPLVWVALLAVSGAAAVMAVRKKDSHQPKPEFGSTVMVNVPQTAPAQRQGAILFCQGGPLRGKSFPITQTPLVIGRDTSCGVCYPITEKGVSRIHCEIRLREGEVYLMDRNSSFGTFLNGRRLAPMVPTAIPNGAVFWLADQNNTFTVKKG